MLPNIQNLHTSRLFTLQLKQTENEQSLKCLAEYLQELDRMEFEKRQLALAEGMLAGNVFDWGAREVTQIMETQTFGFKEATERLQGALRFVVFHIFLKQMYM